MKDSKHITSTITVILHALTHPNYTKRNSKSTKTSKTISNFCKNNTNNPKHNTKRLSKANGKNPFATFHQQSNSHIDKN